MRLDDLERLAEQKRTAGLDRSPPADTPGYGQPVIDYVDPAVIKKIEKESQGVRAVIDYVHTATGVSADVRPGIPGQPIEERNKSGTLHSMDGVGATE